MGEKFKEEFKMLEENHKIRNMVYNHLIKRYGLKSNLKGFYYLVDIISLSLIKKNYSRTTINELSPFIAYKYRIKAFSVQRQLRYVCTIATNNRYKVVDICSDSWYFLKRRLQEESERERKNEN